MKSQKTFEWACSLYILSLLIVLPFMTWKDTGYVVAIALIGYGLGKWKDRGYESCILPLAVAYLAAKPFLHYGPYPTTWSWQRYVVLVETILLGVILLVARRGMGVRPSRDTRDNSAAPTAQQGFGAIRFFPAAIAFVFAGLIATCAVPYIFGRPLTPDLLPPVLAVVCFMIVYPVFLRCFDVSGAVISPRSAPVSREHTGREPHFREDSG